MVIIAAMFGAALPIAPAEVLTSDRLVLTPLSVDDAREMQLVLANPSSTGSPAGPV